MEIYISSTAFRGRSVSDLITLSEEEGILIEFSSSMDYDPEAYTKIQSAGLQCLTHNYFPPAKEAFVLNLASQNEGILEKSLDHVTSGISFAGEINAPFYAAHAGFCLDPDPQDLGGELKPETIQNRDNYWNAFLKSVQHCIDLSATTGTQFLIENNVLNRKNYQNYGGVNPLLCCDGEEIKKLFSKFNNPKFGLLLDTGHLKVSAQTLGFDIDKAIDEIKPYVKAIHHSDNDGYSDSNLKLTDEYWFKKYVSVFQNLPHVIEVKDITVDEARNQLEMLRSFVS